MLSRIRPHHRVFLNVGRKISQALKGRKLSDEHRAKIRATHKGMLGKQHSEETRQRMSESARRSRREKCPGCDLVTLADALTVHRKATGH